MHAGDRTLITAQKNITARCSVRTYYITQTASTSYIFFSFPKMDQTNNLNTATHIPSGLSLGQPSNPNPPKRKRSKFVRNTTTSHQLVSNPKPARKPDPSAPKITRPCTECGRKFWSWKALFGHMRCHPDRQWRGIVPPPNFRRDVVTEEDHEVAAYLLMLANGPPLPCADASDNTTSDEVVVGRFECSSCKKVFGSHQALGGHRASHKNVKGCYAITKSVDGEEFEGCCLVDDNSNVHNNNDNNNNNNNNGHKCSICFRVFSSGQALGGHMRCHWEKVSRVFDFDLNLAAPFQDDGDAADDDDPCFACCSGPALSLRLGL